MTLRSVRGVRLIARRPISTKRSVSRRHQINISLKLIKLLAVNLVALVTLQHYRPSTVGLLQSDPRSHGHRVGLSIKINGVMFN